MKVVRGQKIGQQKKAQTIVEYTLIVGVLVGLLVAMTPLMRRGIQGMVKTVADQVGNQQNAEQIGGDSGHLDDAHTTVHFDQERRVREYLGTTTYDYVTDRTETQSVVFSNLGFTPGNN